MNDTATTAKRRPDWILTCKRKDAPRGTHSTKFGAGWINQFGGINITVDRGCKFPDPALYWVSMQENEYADGAPPQPQCPAKPLPPPAAATSADDYMERKRQERQQPPAPPADDDGDLGPSFLR